MAITARPLLEILHLGFRYPSASKAALTDVSLKADRGEILGLLGPNGAGKTTLISHLSAGLAVQTGSISIDGQAFAQVHKAHPTRVSVAPQEYAFYPMLTVRENLQCFSAACGLASAPRRQREQESLDFAQLNQFQKTQAKNLSGGLKRRLNLAIAVLPKPDLYVFDEPTVGVDPQSRAFILDAIKALAQQGSAVIYTSHYMEEIEAVADQVAILDGGRILRNDSLANLLQAGSLTVRFTSNKALSPPVQEALAAMGAVTQQGSIIEIRPNTHTKLSAIISTLEASDQDVSDLQVGRATLEQVFLALTDRQLRDE
ncbi:ABC transporter ATP-binding protein [Hydrogenophaga sp. PAMC20947]|uniref:ABC transporter ATP-binding protein n=1 Tax=Hydrogenophaga sp. PAMC20947 TaxID=2565558 RepID=UPI001FFA9EDA|nr:ABC transporter ATP-binding protein [Hydrogenophaga sp. PAMC20947]